MIDNSKLWCISVVLSVKLLGRKGSAYASEAGVRVWIVGMSIVKYTSLWAFARATVQGAPLYRWMAVIRPLP